MATSRFSQVHTDVKSIITSKGSVNVPSETGRADRSIPVSFYDTDDSRVATGYYDGKQIHTVQDSNLGLQGRVGVKVRINDSDGDGTVGIKDLLGSARLDGFFYPARPLLETVEI